MKDGPPLALRPSGARNRFGYPPHLRCRRLALRCVGSVTNQRISRSNRYYGLTLGYSKFRSRAPTPNRNFTKQLAILLAVEVRCCRYRDQCFTTIVPNTKVFGVVRRVHLQSTVTHHGIIKTSPPSGCSTRTIRSTKPFRIPLRAILHCCVYTLLYLLDC